MLRDLWLVVTLPSPPSPLSRFIDGNGTSNLYLLVFVLVLSVILLLYLDAEFFCLSLSILPSFFLFSFLCFLSHPFPLNICPDLVALISAFITERVPKQPNT